MAGAQAVSTALAYLVRFSLTSGAWKNSPARGLWCGQAGGAVRRAPAAGGTSRGSRVCGRWARGRDGW
eukprot:2861352-Prymnesium_polylepis.1